MVELEMMLDDLTAELAAFRERQKRQRLLFALLVLGVVAAILLILAFSFHHAKVSERAARKAERDLSHAENSLQSLAAGRVERIESLDQQGLRLSGGEDPTLYLWRSGLRKNTLDLDTVGQLTSILNERKFLIADSGPLLGSSHELARYVCDHIWLVIGESGLRAQAHEYIQRRIARDPRWAVVDIVRGHGYPTEVGLGVGFFLTQSEAKKLVGELSLPDDELRDWGYLNYKPPCPNQPVS
jgi:hypothetical protein